MNEQDQEVYEPTEVVPMRAMDIAGIDSQIEVAKRYPRSVEAFRREAEKLATYDEETAASMFYAMPRGGKTIEGPSIRLAEICAYSWGNILVQGEIESVEQKQVIAVGTAIDLERIHATRVTVPRSIWGKHGRFNADMINVTCRAAIAIARREAILSVIPRVYVNSAYQKARRASLGEGGTFQQKLQKMLDWFGKAGVTPERIYEALGIKGEADIGEDELITLRGLATAIKDGETTVERAFGREGSESDQAEGFKDKVRQKAGKAPAGGDGTSESKRQPEPEAGDAPEDALPPEPDYDLPWPATKPGATVDDVKRQLSKIQHRETLVKLRVMEQLGENRKSAIDAINARLRAVETETAGEDEPDEDEPTEDDEAELTALDAKYVELRDAVYTEDSQMDRVTRDKVLLDGSTRETATREEFQAAIATLNEKLAAQRA